MITIGIKENQTPVSINVFSIPHILICGSTGTGKTSFVRTILAKVSEEYHPTDVRFIILDSKVVDYVDFSGIPHILIPVVTDAEKEIAALSWLHREAEVRLMQFSSLTVNNIAAYNQKMETKEHKLPELFCIIDDCSALYDMPEFVSLLYSILQVGRSVGIHLWLVTSLFPQRGPIRQQLLSIPNRIVFHVSTLSESRTLLDKSGGEKLPVPGVFLLRQYGTAIQCRAEIWEDE